MLSGHPRKILLREERSPMHKSLYVAGKCDAAVTAITTDASHFPATKVLTMVLRQAGYPLGRDLRRLFTSRVPHSVKDFLPAQAGRSVPSFLEV